MRKTGKVSSIGKNGFGFITTDDGAEYFFHATALPQPDQFDDLSMSTQVSFKPISTAKGPRAIEVRIEDE